MGTKMVVVFFFLPLLCFHTIVFEEPTPDSMAFEKAFTNFFWLDASTNNSKKCFLDLKDAAGVAYPTSSPNFLFQTTWWSSK